MKTGGGDFSAEAYQQLREAYDKEQQRAVDDEIKGTQLMGMEYGLETLPVDSPWKDKVENWEYPSGKGQYIDEHQSPDEILKIMREAAQERVEAKKTEEVEEETEEEEVEELPVEEEETETEEDSEDEEDEDDEEEEDEDEDEADSEDEDEVEEESDTEDEDEVESEEEEEEDFDAEALAAEIAELRAEIESLSFITDDQVEESDDDVKQ